MDITSLYNISSGVIKEAANTPSVYDFNPIALPRGITLVFGIT